MSRFNIKTTTTTEATTTDATTTEAFQEYELQYFKIICACDIVLFCGTLIWNYMEYQVQSPCNGPRPYTYQAMRLIIMTLQPTAKNISGCLVLLLSSMHLFPNFIPSTVNFWVVSGLAGFNAAWQIWFYSHWDIVEAGSCPAAFEFQSYELRTDCEWLFAQKITHDYLKSVPVVLHTISVIIQYWNFGIRKKNLNEEKTILVYLFSLSFLTSEYIDESIVLFDHVLLEPYYLIQQYFIRYRIIAKTILTMVYTTHCFICFVTSSDYLAAVRKFARRWRRKEDSKTIQVDVPTASLTRISTNIEAS
ncbi:hypothetical protein GCK72_020629 [Caenorhabditis remanei]|uniref:Uncharacterized protein n=1 Tax=Caenorhabditis remanei TaxID=31234 RepID=A0A6A5GHI5_CAERE|nr:hypothetical protein GCK72_020629 [Caenorhabditis remanei]KAF1754071.1 hypothetical protein GCK72_020629 [Caenorhabditis remanei]